MAHNEQFMKVVIVDLLSETPFYDRYLAEALRPLVDDLTVYASQYGHVPDWFLPLGGAYSPGAIHIVSKLSALKGRWKRLRVPEYLLNLACLLIRFQADPPDVLHIQWLPLLTRFGVELFFVAQVRKLGISVVYTVHNLLPHDQHHHAAIRERYRRAYNLMDSLIVHTASDRAALQSQFGVPSEKIFEVKQGPVFHNLKAELSDREQMRKALGWGESWFCFLIFGGIRPYKGVEEAIRALPAVVSRCAQARLVIIGRGGQRYLSSLQALARQLGVAEAMIWQRGFVPIERVAGLYAASDVALFPYRAISQSAALLTAAAFGSCILAANVGGIPEVIQDGRTGMLWRTRDPAELAECMIRCISLSSAERQRLGQAARELVLTECSWGEIAAQTLRVYEWTRAVRQFS